MFQKYSSIPVCPLLSKPPTVPYCPPPRPEKWEDRVRAALPESVRLRVQVDACPMYIRPGISSANCLPGGEEGENGGGVGNGGNLGTPGTAAPVEVRSLSAGEYIQLVAAQTLNAASNASNPETRFQQYFPESVPAPLSVVCPERIPNPVTVRDRFCVPQAMFAASTPE